jgi:multiple sugar transport system substrate-binding protein
MKKKLLAIILTFAMIFTLTACGGDADKPTPSDTGNGDASPAERKAITFAAQDDPTPATSALIDAFNASQDKYTAVWEKFTNDSGAMRDQLITSLKAGSADYDVMSLDVGWAGEFAAAGYIDPIDTYLSDAGLAATEFNAGSMNSGRYNAKQYALPFFPDLGILYFRKDIVSEADAAKLVSGDYTFADLQKWAEQYKGKEGTKDGFVYQSSKYEGLICNANEFSDNFKDLKAGFESMKTMADSKATPTDILNYTESETANSFIKGGSVFARNWPYQWGSIKSEGTITIDQVDIAPLPYGGSVGGWLLALNKNSGNKDGAFALMQFIATAEGQKILSTQGGYLPGFNASLEDPEVVASNELLSLPGFQKALTTTIARPVSPEYTKLSDALQQAIYGYLTGDADIEKTVKSVETTLAE